MLEALPSSLFSLPTIDILFNSRHTSVVYKTLFENLEDKNMYLSSIALLVVVKGKQIIRNYDGGHLVVNENEVVLLPKDLYVVSDFVAREQRFEAIIFFIDEFIIKRFLLFHPLDKAMKEVNKGAVKLALNRELNEYICSLKAHKKSRWNNEGLLEIAVIEFLLLLAMQDNVDTFMSSLMSPVKKRNIKQFMEDNYLANLKVNDYAILTGRSVSTFTREFKKLYGTTPNKWLISKRMDKASELLNDTNMTVTEVSLEVGYENVSHFIKAYKDRYGFTPKQLQNISE